jgi:RHS repeat-associated protein
MAIWNRDHITPRAGQQAASPGESGFGLYAVTDHIGRPVMSVLWFNGSIQWEASYRPFGELHSQTGIAPLNLRFPGQYFDAETGLHYNYFRDYDPATGRYIQSDPIGLSGGWNTYGYAEANPIRFSDLYGLAIYACFRGVYVGIGNHSYIWNDKSKRCCGRIPGTDPSKDCDEKGPDGGDYCIKVSGSDGREESIMNCCKERATQGRFFPVTNDCQTTTRDCLDEFNLKLPIPGDPGRLGSCSSCGISQSDPDWEGGGPQP